MARKSTKTLTMNAKSPTVTKSAKNAKTAPAKNAKMAPTKKFDKTKPPSGQIARNNRKRTNSKNPSDPKRAKTISASEIYPLTMGDIPDIVAAVVGPNQQQMLAYRGPTLV